MKHFHDIPVALVNDATNPVVYEFDVDKGLITECGVFFPPGCHGRVYAKIFFQAHQILPRNQENWCHGNAGWWSGDLYFPVTAAPLTIKIIAYGDECINPHTITAALELTPFTMIPAWDKLIWLLTKMVATFGVKVPKPTPTEMTME